MDPIERTSTRVAYRNDWMTVREDRIRRPDGSAGVYGVIDKPAYVLVIAIKAEPNGEQVRLVEQFRYPLGMRRWEFPQGTAPGLADIDATELAARELREETGLRAETMTALGILDVAPRHEQPAGSRLPRHRPHRG